MKQEHKIKYCKTCKKFYTCSCNCSPNSFKLKVTKTASLETCICSMLSLIWKFLYLHNTKHNFIKMNNNSTNFFSKYIYLDSPSYNYKKLKLDDLSVYMLSVPSEQDFEQKESDKKIMPIVPVRPTSSFISVSSNKSTGGNILANWFNKTRKKKKKTNDYLSETTLKSRAITEEIYYSEEEQSDNSSNQTHYAVIKEVNSKSKIPILKHNFSKINFQKMLLLQKFTVKNVNDKNSGKCRSYVSITPTEKVEEPLKRSKSDANMEPLWKCSYTDTNTPIYKLETFDLNARLALDLHEVISILTQLKESEVHISHLISKFIEDRSFQRQLLEIITTHSKLHVTAELRTQNLTTEMWLYQNEVLKNQETAMQERLSMVIKHNRMLQNSIENLMSKNEKLCIRIQQVPDYFKPSSDAALLETMNKNNDHLRCKIGILSQQIEKEEIEYSKLQKKHIILEQQLQNFNLKLQNYKDAVDRIQSESKLEQKLLIYDLQNSQKVLKEIAEAGDVVLEDLDSLKRQFKSIAFTINWTKFRCRGNSLPDLIYICRSCINELSEELLRIQNDIVLKDKDINSLKQEISKYDAEKKQTKHEHNSLHEKINLLTFKEAELQSYKHKYEEGEEIFKKHKEQMQTLLDEYEKKVFALQDSVKDLDNLKKEVIEKDEELLLVKEQVAEYKAENDTLRMQLQGLKQVLSATGTGEVARELAETQEKLVAFQSQYYQILTEKNILIEKLQSANLEMTSLNQFQSSSSQFIQTQQRELDTLKNDCLLLKQQFDLEKQQCSVLVNERNKLKEEKSVMKQIYMQLKAEVSRVQALEGKMAGMNIEANRLALIADYNKQLGEKLQCEVAEKDVKITELESNMKELNHAQLENAKDKVALCVELKEVCSLNDRLSNSLEFEQQKIDELHQSRQKIENAASVQLQAAEQMQKKERIALLELLKEYKTVVAQRDNLLLNQNDHIQQITELRANIAILSKNSEESHQKCVQQIEVIQILEKSLMQSKEELQKISNKADNQQEQSTKIKNECLKLKEQKEALDESVMYLQNTIQQLHKDLNKTRETEINIMRELENEKKKFENSESLFEEQQKSLNHAQKDNEELIGKTSKLNNLYEELLQNYKHDVEINSKNAENLRQELSNSNDVIIHQKNLIENLHKQILEKEKDVKDFKTKCELYAIQICTMEKTIQDSILQSQQLAENKIQQNLLESNLETLNKDYEEICKIIPMLKQDIENLQEQLQTNVEKTEIDSSFYKSYIKEMSSKHYEDRKELEQDLETFAIELQELKSKFERETQQKNELTKQKKHLAEQLLTATEMVINEKKKNQQINLNMENIGQEYKGLLKEKEELIQVSRRLSQEVNNLKSRIRDHMLDKQKLHKIISHLEKVRGDQQCNLNSSVVKIEEIHQKCQHLENYRNDVETVLQNTENKLKISQELVKVMKTQLDDNHATVMNLELEISKLRQELIAVEFQKSEVTLHLHKLQASLRTEQSLNVELTSVNQKIVSEMLKIEHQPSTSKSVKHLCESDSSSIN